jgi:hypothetical protein
MRIEAVKVAEGFLIPLREGFQNITQERILLEVEIIDPAQVEAGYAALDQLVGLCETGDTAASVEHDQRVYRPRDA